MNLQERVGPRHRLLDIVGYVGFAICVASLLVGDAKAAVMKLAFGAYPRWSLEEAARSVNLG